MSKSETWEEIRERTVYSLMERARYHPNGYDNPGNNRYDPESCYYSAYFQGTRYKSRDTADLAEQLRKALDKNHAADTDALKGHRLT